MHRAPTVRRSAPSSATLVLTGDDVRRVLAMPECIDAVEDAFRRHADGETISPGILGAHVEDGGFHVKTAGLAGTDTDDAPFFAAKVNANFPANPSRSGLPTIQGVLALFDARNGQVLAVLDSIAITSLRTAAATAVAAKYLARHEAETVTICGCGEQGRSQLRALACVRPIRTAFAIDIHHDHAERYATEMSAALGIDVHPVQEFGEDTYASDIWVTCTTARHWFLARKHVAPGAFVAAVGADNPEKQELEPALLAASAVIVDVLEQCASIGDLHHALADGVMNRDDVRGELADVISGRCRGRQRSDEVVVFDSTGTALQDVAAAALVYRRAVEGGVGIVVDLGGRGE